MAVLVDEDNLLVPSRLPDELPQMQGRKDKLVNSTMVCSLFVLYSVSEIWICDKRCIPQSVVIVLERCISMYTLKFFDVLLSKLPFSLFFQCPLHRHYAMPYVPHGMWPRLISRVLGDKQLKQVIINQLPQSITSAQGTLKWHAWKTGAELRWNAQPILRLQETTGSLLSLPEIDPSLVRVTICDYSGPIGSADIIQSSNDVGIQLWVASNPVKICDLSDSQEVPDESSNEAEMIETYSRSTNRRYSITAVDGFVVIDTDDDFQHIGNEAIRQSHKGSNGRDLGYETYPLQSDMATSRSVDKPQESCDADTRSVGSFVNSVSSFSLTSRPDPLAVELLTRCVSHVDTILQDWYHGMRSYSVYSFCQDCLLAALEWYELSDRINSQSIELCVFDWKASVRQAYCSDTIACVRHQNVPLAWIVPDVVGQIRIWSVTYLYCTFVVVW